MTTIPTALLIIAGLSFCLLMAAILIILPYDTEDMLTKHPGPKPGPCASQRCMIVAVVWLAPTAAMLAGWMVWG